MDAPLAVIGGGRMAEAIVAGLTAAPELRRPIVIAEPLAERRSQLSQAHGVRCVDDNAEAVRGAGLVVLAVKPQVAAAVCEPLTAGDGQVWLSIMAGVSTASLRHWLGDGGVYARAMPNTPALAGRGITGLWLPDGIDTAAAADTRQLLASLGELVEVDHESDLDAVTAISGSGPAYFFAFTEALAAAGRELGLSVTNADRLARATLAGAAALIERTGLPPAELRRQVTSPGGTTEAALARFAADGLDESVMRAARAAMARAIALSQESAPR